MLRSFERICFFPHPRNIEYIAVRKQFEAALQCQSLSYLEISYKHTIMVQRKNIVTADASNIGAADDWCEMEEMDPLTAPTQRKSSSKECHSLHVWQGLLIALACFTGIAVLLWCSILPEVADWWTRQNDFGYPLPPGSSYSVPQQSPSSLSLHISHDLESWNWTTLPGGYVSVEEMNDRWKRFPGVTERVRVYMSNWYTPPCVETEILEYNYVYGNDGDLLLILNEVVLPENSTSDLVASEFDNDDSVRVYSHSANNRTFLLDHVASKKGARIFFLTAAAVRRCAFSPCLDTVEFLFPSLHRINMATQSRDKTGYAGNALDDVDIVTTVPVILQYGDLEVSRAFSPQTTKNESYPATPLLRKFRLAMRHEELERITTENCETRPIPLSVTGDRHLQPIVTKLTVQRHFGMLDEIPPLDIAWSKKKDAAVWRGALTGMKRNGFRVVKTSETTNATKTDMCFQIQRCKMVYLAAESSLVDARLTGTVTFHPHNMIKEPVVPEVLDGIQLYGKRLNYADMLQFKAIIMVEGNDVSSGMKWALFSNSVVLAQPAQFTSWAMEELLQPYVHYVPLDDTLSNVETQMRWVLDNEKKAQSIAKAGKLWISDLMYHPNAVADDAAIFDETFLRYKQHFSLNPDLVQTT